MIAYIFQDQVSRLFNKLPASVRNCSGHKQFSKDIESILQNRALFRFVIDRVLCHRPSFVPSTEFCVIDRVLCHRPSFVSLTEFCAIDRDLCHRTSFVSSTEICAIDRVLSHRPSSVPSTEFLCHRPSFEFVSSTEFFIDRVLCHRHRPSFVSVLTDERQYL